MASLSDDVLRVLRDCDDWVSGREIQEHVNGTYGRALAYTTVTTVLTRLLEKSAVQRRREGKRYLYRASAPNDAAQQINDLLREHGSAAVVHFVALGTEDSELRARLQEIASGQ